MEEGAGEEEAQCLRGVAVEEPSVEVRGCQEEPVLRPIQSTRSIRIAVGCTLSRSHETGRSVGDVLRSTQPGRTGHTNRPRAEAFQLLSMPSRGVARQLCSQSQQKQ